MVSPWEPGEGTLLLVVPSESVLGWGVDLLKRRGNHSKKLEPPAVVSPWEPGKGFGSQDVVYGYRMNGFHMAVAACAYGKRGCLIYFTRA